MDASSFEGLYNEHSGLVLGFLTTQTRNRALAEDLAGETWLKAWRAIQRGVEPETPGAWLTTIAKRLWIDHTRKNEFGRAVSLDGLWEDTNPEYLEWLTDPHDMENEIAEYVDALKVHSLLAVLPVRQRQAIWFRYVDGFTDRELGQAMGCTEGAAKAVQHRGMVTLRERITA